jgi:pimeloyl-ACP methyl ester carboxylesterase
VRAEQIGRLAERQHNPLLYLSTAEETPMNDDGARTVSVDGARIHLVDRGEGPAVLFLHGNPDSSDLWRDVIAALEGRYRCLAPDLPGFGRSEVPAAFDCSLDHMARFVASLLDAAGVEGPVHLVVHDFGGPYGLAWAVRHPDRVRSVAAIDTTFFADFRWHAWARVWRTPVLGELSMMTMNRWTFERELRRGSRKLSAVHIRRTYALVTPRTKRMVLELYRATNPENFAGWEERMLEITARVPSLVLWGDHDPYIHRRFADRFGAGEVVHFPDCGHWVPAEAPAEVAARLGELFARRDDPADRA